MIIQLMPTPIPDLVERYLRQYRTQSHEDFWAVEEVNEGVRHDLGANDAWALTLALVAAAEDGALGYVGAGPLEDFVQRFGPGWIAKIEEAARRDPKFCECLGRIWLREGDLPADILARLVEASHGQIRPLPRDRA